MHHEARVFHPIYQAIFPYLTSNRNTNLLSCVFWILLLDSHAILGSLCEGPFLTLGMYWTTLSITIISIWSDPISRRVYEVHFLTCRKCFWTFSNSFQVDLGMLLARPKLRRRCWFKKEGGKNRTRRQEFILLIETKMTRVLKANVEPEWFNIKQIFHLYSIYRINPT